MIFARVGKHLEVSELTKSMYGILFKSKLLVKEPVFMNRVAFD